MSTTGDNSYWRYRAYDAAGTRVGGVVAADAAADPAAVVLKLRQAGLQAYDMWAIDNADYVRIIRHDRVLKRLRCRAAAVTRSLSAGGRRPAAASPAPPVQPATGRRWRIGPYVQPLVIVILGVVVAVLLAALTKVR